MNSKLSIVAQTIISVCVKITIISTPSHTHTHTHTVTHTHHHTHTHRWRVCSPSPSPTSPPPPHVTTLPSDHGLSVSLCSSEGPGEYGDSQHSYWTSRSHTYYQRSATIKPPPLHYTGSSVSPVSSALYRQQCQPTVSSALYRQQCLAHHIFCTILYYTCHLLYFTCTCTLLFCTCVAVYH